MEIRTLHLREGAEQAVGLTVIIDVFRAFSLEAYMYREGAAAIIPVKTVEEAFALKSSHPEYLLSGERHGRKVPGFDFGNSPSELLSMDIRGRTVIHTTSAGVQGIAAAGGCSEIITGALVNADAAARYIRRQDPTVVCLVAMGLEGKRRTEEDELCADYIRSLLVGEPLSGIRKRADELRFTEGSKFFDPAQQEAFPEPDFALCTEVGIMDFVIRVKRDGTLFRTERIDI